MMNRRFTMREKILLLICAVLLLGIFYYQMVYVGTIEAAEKYNTENIQTDFDIAKAKVDKMNQMRQDMASGASQMNGEVATYNNLQNEINELNSILTTANTYNLDFSDATVSGDTVRRDISVSFHTTDYAAAKAIIEKLSTCQYRCMIKDLDLSTTSTQATGITNSGDLNVSLIVTFYETTNGATTKAGLTQAEDDSSSTDSSDDMMTTQ